MAARLGPGDGSRIARALEVILSTQKSLTEWQAAAPLKYDFPPFHIISVQPREAGDRTLLYKKIDQRAHEMLQAGAVNEVKEVLKAYPQLPVFKQPIGVGLIKSFLDQEIPLPSLLQKLQEKTRQYAKRQITWGRHKVNGEIPLPILHEGNYELCFRSLVDTLGKEGTLGYESKP